MLRLSTYVYSLQINMDWSAVAHEFLAQFSAKIKVDLVVSVLISNQYRNENLAVIWVRGGTHFRVLAQRLKEYIYLNSVFGNNVFQRLSNTQWNDAGLSTQT